MGHKVFRPPLSPGVKRDYSKPDDGETNAEASAELIQSLDKNLSLLMVKIKTKLRSSEDN